MSGLKRFASCDKNVIERRDCLFDPYTERRSSYLRRKDVEGPRVDFKPVDKENFKISEIRFGKDENNGIGG